MGQCWKCAINYLGEGKKTTFYNGRKVDGCGEYIGAKLREHSYFGNNLMDAVAQILHDYETKLAWIGDYANEDDEVNKITKGEASYEDCWGSSNEDGTEVEPKDDFVFKKAKFDYSKKLLVNLTKGEYISFDEYIEKATSDWQLNPISILTAIGNGRGGGDFYSEEQKVMDKVGSWAWDVITIDDEEPKGMKKLEITFEEG